MILFGENHCVRVGRIEGYSGPYLQASKLKNGPECKCRPEKTPSMDIFHAVCVYVYKIDTRQYTRKQPVYSRK